MSDSFQVCAIPIIHLVTVELLLPISSQVALMPDLPLIIIIVAGGIIIVEMHVTLVEQVMVAIWTSS